MDQNVTSNDESMVARIEQLEKERDELHEDIEHLCMQQAGPDYPGVATRMHFPRTDELEQEIENLKAKLAVCTRENQNLQEEISEAYRIKSQLADLHSAEVLKSVEAEKQLKFFQSCVASAFAERDTAIMEAEKAKETQRRIEELTSELLEEKKLVTTLQADLETQKTQHEIFQEVIDKFYNIRQGSLENIVDTSMENKCDCLLSDSAEMWRFENDEKSTYSYIYSLEAEIDTLKKAVDNLQNKLRVGLEIESHLKKKFRDLQKSQILSEEKMRKQISALLCSYSQYKTCIRNILDEWRTELKSISDMVVEKVREIELSGEQNLKSSPTQDVHNNTDSNQTSGTKAERHLLERNANSALQKTIEELQRNLLQVTNEKVKALMELAQLKQEKYVLEEMKIENSVFKEILERMEHLLSSVRRLRISLLKVKDSAAEKTERANCFDSLDTIIAESKLVKIPFGSSLPISWSTETDGSHCEMNDGGSDPGHEKVDFVSAAGLEMVDLLILAAHVLKEHISHQDQGDCDTKLISQ